MASRYEQREIVVQALFEGDFNDCLDTVSVMSFLKRDAKEFLLLEDVPDFAESLAVGVVLKRDLIDEIIEKAAPEWPIHKISFIDRALLRLGIFELLFGGELNIPPKVAINEAIELSKAFGGDNSRKFVNGVLGGIYKEMSGDENAKSNEIKPKKEIVYENLVGAFVYRKVEDKYEIAFIRDLFKHFTVSKGHLLEGKEALESLVEIVKSEIQIDIKVGERLGENVYTADSKNNILKKIVVYYLAEIVEEHQFTPSMSIPEMIWCDRERAESLKSYKDMKDLIVKAFDSIESK